MFDWLKNLFKSTEQIEREAADKYFGNAGDNVVVNEEHDDAKQLEEKGNTLVEGQENTLVEDAAPISKEPKFTKAQTMSGGREKLQYLQGILEASQKGGRGSGNSEKFTAVTDVLDEINAHMNSDHFSDKADNNFQIMGPMVDRYNSLIVACSDYLSRSAFTSAGKHRKAIVSQVLSLATQDIAGINVAMDQIGRADPASMASTSWNDILNKARAIEVDVDFSNVKVFGGQVNKVYELTGENSSAKKNDGTLQQLEDTKFFKPIMTYDARNTERQQALCWLSQEVKLSKKDYDFLAALDGNYKERDTGEFPKDARLNAYAQKLIDFGIAAGAMKTSFADAVGGEALGEFNVTSRNVATSRMADLLGVSNIIARSELAEVTDKVTGEKKQGVLIDKAEGVDGAELQVEHLKKGKQSRGRTETDYTDASKNLMAPTFAKQMMQLGILDYICGQVDRHSNNYKIKLDEDGRAMAVQGIDNDGSFGLDTGFTEGKWMNQVFDLEGNLTYPIDKAIAERITTVSSSAIKYALRGLIADDCVDACIARLNNIKKAIQKAPEDMIIANDSGWGAETQQKMFDEDRERLTDAYFDAKMEKFKYKGYKNNVKGVLDVVGSATSELFKKMYGDRDIKSLSEDEDRVFEAELVKLKNYESSFYGRSVSTLGMFAFHVSRQ